VSLENGLTVSHKSILKPRKSPLSLPFGVSALDIVVRERDVEWILPRQKTHGDKILARFEIRVVITAVLENQFGSRNYYRLIPDY